MKSKKKHNVIKITFSRGYAVLPQVAHLSCVPENILAALLGDLVWIADFGQNLSLLQFRNTMRQKLTHADWHSPAQGPTFPE